MMIDRRGQVWRIFWSLEENLFVIVCSIESTNFIDHMVLNLMTAETDWIAEDAFKDPSSRFVERVF